MIKEWNKSLVFQFDNGYKVRIPYIKSLTLPVPTRSKIDVLGPNDEYLTPNFLTDKFGSGLDADEITTILARVKNIDPNEDFNIL